MFSSLFYTLAIIEAYPTAQLPSSKINGKLWKVHLAKKLWYLYYMCLKKVFIYFVRKLLSRLVSEIWDVKKRHGLVGSGWFIFLNGLISLKMTFIFFDVIPVWILSRLPINRFHFNFSRLNLVMSELISIIFTCRSSLWERRIMWNT